MCALYNINVFVQLWGKIGEVDTESGRRRRSGCFSHKCLLQEFNIEEISGLLHRSQSGQCIGIYVKISLWLLSIETLCLMAFAE